MSKRIPRELDYLVGETIAEIYEGCSYVEIKTSSCKTLEIEAYAYEDVSFGLIEIVNDD